MADDASKQDKGSVPPEAKRRGGMDTLFSAAWFDDPPPDAKGASSPPASSPAAKGGGAQVAAEPEKRGSPMVMIAALLGFGLLVGIVLCAGAGIAGGAYYVYVMSAMN